MTLRPNPRMSSAQPAGRPDQNKTFVTADRAIGSERNFRRIGTFFRDDIAIFNFGKRFALYSYHNNTLINFGVQSSIV